jgi:hypothetical protein
MMSFNPDRINIHELTIEEPETKEKPEFLFDPSRLLSEGDWQALQMLAKQGDLYTNASIAITDRKKIQEMSAETKENSLKSIESDASKGDFQSLAWAKYLSPELTQIPDDVLESGIEKDDQKISELREKNDWRHLLEHVAWRTVIGHSPKLDAEDFNKMKAEFETQKSGEYLIEEGAAMSIIYPDYPLKFSEENSKKMESHLKRHIQNRTDSEWYLFIAMAKIVTDKCTEVALRKPFNAETTPIPEIKKF